MAENKVVNTTQLDAGLTSIADAIRAKAESSDSLVFPSGFVDAIANIVTGGGVPSGFSVLSSGTFTPASDVTTYTFGHGLNVIPNFYIIFPNEDYTLSAISATILFCLPFGLTYGGKTRETPVVFVASNSSGSSFSSVVVSTTTGISETEIKTPTNALSSKFRSGVTYRWICGVIDKK